MYCDLSNSNDQFLYRGGMIAPQTFCLRDRSAMQMPLGLYATKEGPLTKFNGPLGLLFVLQDFLLTSMYMSLDHSWLSHDKIVPK